MRGFTIVELLVVIVLIAILAVISITGYNGVQNRAYASKAASVVDSYSKLIELYKASEGVYPVANYACLSESLPANARFGSNVCDSMYGDAIDPAFNQKLKTHAKTLPDGMLPEVNYDSDIFSRAPVYVGSENGGTIYYYLNGDYTCPRGETASWRDGTTVCAVQMGEAYGGADT